MQTQITAPKQVQHSPPDPSSYYLNVPLSFINAGILSPKEAMLLSKIIYLTNANKKYNSCFASCKTLADWLGSSQAAASFGVNTLERLGYIKKSWIIDNITRGSKYMSTKHKMPTKAAYELQKEAGQYLKIPDDIVSSKILNATDKIVYGVLLLLARHFKENISVKNISDVLGFPSKVQIYRILRKLHKLELITKDNIPHAIQEVLSSLKQEHSYKPRGKSAPHYAPSLPGFGVSAIEKASDELHIPFSFEKPKPITFAKQAERKPAVNVTVTPLGFNEAMEAFINGIPNIMRPYRERGDNFEKIVPYLRELDERYKTDINMKAFIKSHGIIIDMLHKKGFKLEKLPTEYIQNIYTHLGSDAIMAEIPPISGQALKETLDKLEINFGVGGHFNSLEEILCKLNSPYIKDIVDYVCLHNKHYRELSGGLDLCMLEPLRR